MRDATTSIDNLHGDKAARYTRCLALVEVAGLIKNVISMSSNPLPTEEAGEAQPFRHLILRDPLVLVLRLADLELADLDDRH